MLVGVSGTRSGSSRVPIDTARPSMAMSQQTSLRSAVIRSPPTPHASPVQVSRRNPRYPAPSATDGWESAVRYLGRSAVARLSVRSDDCARISGTVGIDRR